MSMLFSLSDLFSASISAKMSRKGLMEQDLSKLDVTKLHPLSPEVISRQATINIGNFSIYTYSDCLSFNNLAGLYRCLECFCQFFKMLTKKILDGQPE